MMRPHLSRDSGNPSQMEQLSESSYLALKSGVTLRPHGSDRSVARYIVGLPRHGLILQNPLHVQVVRALDGTKSARQLADGLICSTSEVFHVAHSLLGAGLLEVRDDRRRVQPIGQGDLSADLIATRRGTELSLLSHRTSTSDGGIREFVERQNALILISGENRLARHLLATLHASGFTRTRLIPRSHISTHLSIQDVCGVIVGHQDIGTSRTAFNEELIRRAQISKPELGKGQNPDLIISTIPLEWDYVQRWMSEGSVHLHINQMIGSEIEIGPLVRPGADPCLRCVTLIKRDNQSDVSQEFIRSQTPTAAISYIAGLLTLAIGEYFASGESALRATSHWYELLSPLRPPDIRHWSFHPECGCQD